MERLHFSLFSEPVEKRINNLFKTATAVLSVETSRDEIKQVYLDSYPKEVNVIFRERLHYDGVYDIQFVRTLGRCIFVLPDNTYTTIWDLKVEGYFQQVADTMHTYILSKINPSLTWFSYSEPKVGSRPNKDGHDTNITWTHFYSTVPKSFTSVPNYFNNLLSPVKRSLTTYTVDILDTVLDLIDSNSIYRGQEHKQTILDFKSFLQEYNSLKTDIDKLIFIYNSISSGKKSIAIRSTVIGTLLDDLVEGKDLEQAVKSFEKKVAPENYKRSSAVITQGMIKLAQQKVQELNLTESLKRRFATEEDLNVNDVLFTQRNAIPLDVFETLTEESKATVNKNQLDKAKQLSLNDFINGIVPKASSIELLVENKHTSNFVSLITAQDNTSPTLFKWDNHYSWSYNGGVTDSLRERVQELGGRVDGVIRFSHSWNHDQQNQSLMDLHVFGPDCNLPHTQSKEEIHNHYPHGIRVGWNSRKDNYTGGVQDVDYVEAPGTNIPVENITFPNMNKLPEGKYIFKIHNWKARNPNNSGFKAQIELKGKSGTQLFDYEYTKPVKNHQWITLAEATLEDGDFEVTQYLETKDSIKDVWGVKTNTWTKINTITLSPNFWDNKQIGNKHLFMFIDKCVNPDSANGFYNEFLRSDLKENRKVFEVLGSKMKAVSVPNQLSGLGFSSTIKNDFYVRITNPNNSKTIYKILVNSIDI